MYKKYYLVDLERTNAFGTPYYWRKNKYGYTPDRRRAGLFIASEADEIVNNDRDNHTLKLAENELYIMKENFIERYAATEEAPTDEEEAWIFSQLPMVVEDVVLSKPLLSSLHCEHEEEDELDVYVVPFDSPLQTSGQEEYEERQIHIIACSVCSKWSLCD